MKTKQTPKKRILLCALAMLLVLNSILGSVLVAKSQPLFDWRKYVEETAVYAARYTAETNEFMEDGRLERAWKYLHTRIGTPKTYEDYELFASIAIAREEFSDAIGYIKGCIETADEADADRGVLYVRLASLHILSEQGDEALAALDDAIEASPDVSVAYYLRGQIYAGMEDKKAATADFKTYMNLPDADPAAMITLANYFEAEEDFEMADACYTSVIESGSENRADLYLGRGRCRGMRNDLKTAKADLEQYFELTDDDPEGQAASLLAMCLMESGEYADAKTYFHKAIEHDFPDPLLLYSQSVKCAFAAEDYEGAIEDGQKALALLKDGQTSQLAPDAEAGAAEIHFWMGLAHLSQSRFNDATDHFAEAKEEAADYSNIDYYLGVSALANEDFEEAGKFFTDSIEKEESVSPSYYNRALCYIQMGQYELAKEDLERVIERGDENDMAEQAKALIGTL